MTQCTYLFYIVILLVTYDRLSQYNNIYNIVLFDTIINKSKSIAVKAYYHHNIADMCCPLDTITITNK